MLRFALNLQIFKGIIENKQLFSGSDRTIFQHYNWDKIDCGFNSSPLSRSPPRFTLYLSLLLSHALTYTQFKSIFVALVVSLVVHVPFFPLLAFVWCENRHRKWSKVYSFCSSIVWISLCKLFVYSFDFFVRFYCGSTLFHEPPPHTYFVRVFPVICAPTICTCFLCVRVVGEKEMNMAIKCKPLNKRQ